ncbi:glycosyltransferase [Mesorhizobium sp. YC-39]|uniref:glycosyltransferase n=1 Tax=unclassified Mesorhizobium TaxID=325217 RepID=UPI0021E86760|nr:MULTISPECIES: glycosyltransferase [unclassified Mesorhizobium]MCV3207080.1 glycosyltransferase [Mesorhizobium sp. YC-2]MCV3228807.1 glycosyltransferase [Mesorhizobium sp. YC-39]
MKILQFTVDCPFPPVSGGEIRNAANARALAGLGEVLIVSFTGAPAPALPPNIRHRIIEAARGRGPWHRRSPHPTVHVIPADELAEAASIWKAFAPDLVVIEDIALSQLLALAHEHGGQTVIDLHNVDSRTVADRIGSLSLWQRWWRFREHHRRMAQAREADILAVKTADQVWVCSEADRAALGPIDGIKASGSKVIDIKVIANPIPDETVLSLPIAARRYEELRLCFIGHLGYFPNIDAVKQIGRKMVPRLVASGQRWSITVAGKNPRDIVRHVCATHGLHLVENPPHVPDLLGRAGYAPIPLRFGGGTRIKALEAMAAGLVVCATEKAVEGLGLEAGTHFLSGRDACELAAKITALAAEPQRAAAMANAGRAFVRDRHSLAAIEQVILQALESLEARRPG